MTEVGNGYVYLLRFVDVAYCFLYVANFVLKVDGLRGTWIVFWEVGGEMGGRHY